MDSVIERGEIVSFAWDRGAGVVRRADGSEIEFVERVVQAPAAALEPGLAVWIEVGSVIVEGRRKVLKLQLDRGEATAPWRPRAWYATPEEALAVLRSAGLGSGMTVGELRDACYGVQAATMAGEMDGREIPAFVNVETVGPWNVIAGLASIYGTKGPSPASVGDRAFVLDESARRDPTVVRRVAEALTQWVGAPIVGAQVDGVIREAAEILFLRQHVQRGGIELFAIEGAMRPDEQHFELFVVGRVTAAIEGMTWVARFVGPDTEAAAAGVFRMNGCSPAFAAHARECAVCQANLMKVVTSGGMLPPEFRALIV